MEIKFTKTLVELETNFCKLNHRQLRADKVEYQGGLNKE